jgi:hypothetical protein
MTPTLWSEFWSPGTATAEAIDAIPRSSVWLPALQLRGIQVGTDVVSNLYSN